MKSICIEISATPEKQEELIAILSDLPVTGFEERTDVLLAWFPDATINETELIPLLQGHSFIIRETEDKNWNEEWEKNFQPVRIGEFCSVRATFHPPSDTTRYEIVITPKMSFGTGHHATTWMMIAQMESILFTGRSVFDFGTGTGILSILAEKLGAEKVLAIDVDEWSVENSMENIIANHCHRTTVSLSSTLPAENFDIILANINRNVILKYLPGLKNILMAGGILILSGLLREDEDAVVTKAVNCGFKLFHTVHRENWISIRLSY